MFVTGVVTDPVQGGQVMLWHLSADGHTVTPIVIGSGDEALPPVLNDSDSVYAAHAGGVVRLSSHVIGSHNDTIASARPVGGLCLAGRPDRPFLAWPTIDRQVVLYQEQALLTLTVDLAPLGRFDGTLFAPLGNGAGTRVLITSSGGSIAAIEIGTNPVGVVAHADLDTALFGPPVEVSGVVYLATTTGILMALREAGEGFDPIWTLDLKGLPAGRLLVDGANDIVVAREDGTVLVVRDGGAFGSVFASASVGMPLGRHAPLVTDHGRILGMGHDGSVVWSLVRSIEADGGLKLSPGLWFEVPIAAVSDANLLDRRLLFATASGHLVAYLLAEELPSTGFGRAGGDVHNRNRMRVLQGEMP